MTLRLALDHYVYEDVYPAFKATTDEKGITAKINRAFLNYLAQRDQVLTGDAPLVVADIGSGPCDTLVMYLEQVRFAPGFESEQPISFPRTPTLKRGRRCTFLRRHAP